jgi:hypothetical protein
MMPLDLMKINLLTTLKKISNNKKLVLCSLKDIKLLNFILTDPRNSLPQQADND